MYRYAFFKLFFLILFFFLPGCLSKTEPKTEVNKKYSLNIVYKEAYDQFNSGNYNESLKLFEIIEKDYSYTEWAPKALLMRSYMYYDAGKYIEALTNLQRFKKRYSGNVNYSYAEYLIALCMFEQINYVSLSQESSELALKQFKKIIQNYPNSEYAKDSKLKIDLIYEHLAGKEMYIARYYMEREKWVPAMYRLNNIVKKYQETIFIEEALHRLVEINYKIGNLGTAKKHASILGYNYNDSDWYKKTYKLIEGRDLNFEKIKRKKNLKEKIKQLIQIN